MGGEYPSASEVLKNWELTKCSIQESHYKNSLFWLCCFDIQFYLLALQPQHPVLCLCSFSRLAQPLRTTSTPSASSTWELTRGISSGSNYEQNKTSYRSAAEASNLTCHHNIQVSLQQSFTSVAGLLIQSLRAIKMVRPSHIATWVPAGSTSLLISVHGHQINFWLCNFDNQLSSP